MKVHKNIIAVADLGEAPKALGSNLIIRPKKAPKGREKNIFESGPPLFQGLDPH